MVDAIEKAWGGSHERSLDCFLHRRDPFDQVSARVRQWWFDVAGDDCGLLVCFFVLARGESRSQFAVWVASIRIVFIINVITFILDDVAAVHVVPIFIIVIFFMMIRATFAVTNFPKGLVSHLHCRGLNRWVNRPHYPKSIHDQLEKVMWVVDVVTVSIAAKDEDIREHFAHWITRKGVIERELQRAGLWCAGLLADASYFVDDQIRGGWILKTVGHDVEFQQILVELIGGLGLITDLTHVELWVNLIIPVNRHWNFIAIDAVQIAAEEFWFMLLQVGWYRFVWVPAL